LDSSLRHGHQDRARHHAADDEHWRVDEGVIEGPWEKRIDRNVDCHCSQVADADNHSQGQRTRIGLDRESAEQKRRGRDGDGAAHEWTDEKHRPWRLPRPVRDAQRSGIVPPEQPHEPDASEKEVCYACNQYRDPVHMRKYFSHRTPFLGAVHVGSEAQKRMFGIWRRPLGAQQVR